MRSIVKSPTAQNCTIAVRRMTHTLLAAFISAFFFSVCHFIDFSLLPSKPLLHIHISITMTHHDLTEHPAVTRFREYLRIKTVQPNPDYVGSTAFLIRQAQEIGMPYSTVEVPISIPCSKLKATYSTFTP